MDTNDFLNSSPVYFPLDLGVLHERISAIKDELDHLGSECWFYDKYRKVEMCSIYSGGGAKNSKKELWSNKNLELKWTENADKTPALKAFLEEKIFEIIKPMGRVTILKTAPGNIMNEHYDCAEDELNKYKPKLRVVVSGEIEGLYFCGESEKVYIPKDFNTYVIDGASAHGMKNVSSEYKYTICIGAPWEGEYTEKGEELLRESIEKYKDIIIFKEQLGQKIKRVDFQNYQEEAY